ncbi:choice-of-anchor A family protein [Nocardioides mangrovi]|uniref:Choice-of-anchor A family protein n=1 Tax=Nocardioides mangrovi TaxID=2874580 RepID=A0ABS7UFB2_9ACTN|nr:choice-of-anchor A family protein [Nocardioides mangrovi]MBZ5739688.1 choice-of-anchor A family protein [Nocardioides mangrovi]
MGGLSALLRANTLRVPVLVSVIAAAGLVAVVAPLDGPADATSPTCSSGTATSNAFGPATGWTEFVETDGTRGAESEGAIAYGGNHAASGFPVGTRLPSGFAATSPALVIAGTHGTYNLQKGSAYVTPASGVNFNGGSGTGHLATIPINFTSAFSDLRTLSTSWGAAAATGTVTSGTAGGNAALVFTGTSTSLNVFAPSVAQMALLASGTHISLVVPAGATTIINVPGTSATFGGQMWVNGNQANDSVMASYPGVVWNFPDATSVTLNFGSAWGGHILAPKAAVTVNQVGHTIGQVIAKSFTSNFETHQNLFPSDACVPGTPPSTPGTSDVTITKSASTASPMGGSTFSYTLTASNVGNADATGVVIRDALPAGVTFVSATSPCTQAAGVVTCNVGTIAQGASTSVTITVTADPIAGAGPVDDSGGNHWMTPYHPEAQVDLEAGQQRSVTLGCNAGDILSDGDFRVDHVDQGTGAFSDVKVLSSQSTAVDTWKGVIRNDTTGRVQAKAFIVCLPGQTEGGADGHRHNLLADNALVTGTQSLPVGHTETTLTCRAGTVPIAPGYDLSAAGPVLSGSEADYTARTWTFSFDATAPVTVTTSVRCLSTTTSAVAGHTHQLRFTHVVNHVSVPGSTPAEGTEYKVTCPDDAKGVVGTFDLPPTVRSWGNDPRLKERAFRLFNQSGTAQDATIDLLCLSDRVGTGMGTTVPVSIVNTATVTSTSTDANSANNSASATVAVQPGSTTATPSGRVAVSGSTAAMRVLSSMPGTGTVRVTSAGTVLAKGTVRLAAGSATTARVRLTKAGKARIGTLSTVRVKVDPSRGKAVTRTVAVG